MSVKALQDPILDQGVRNTHFFEGRLLTGEDLRNQRDADREHDRRLGRAIGPGIVEGLEVELLHDGADGEPPRVRVKKGMAVNGEGDVVGLPKNDITLALTDPRTPPEWEQADFYTCAGPPGVQHLPSGAGVYILVMSPVAGYKERALKNGLGEDGVAKGCGSKYIQEGVRFRLVEFDPSSVSGVSSDTQTLIEDTLFSDSDPVQRDDHARLSKLQNLLAHLCFGTEQQMLNRSERLLEMPLESSDPAFSALDQLRASGKITDCDTCLALFYWSLEGVVLLDNWSVRRMTPPAGVADYQRPTDVAFNRTVAEAAFHQFQQHLNRLVKESTAPQLIPAKEFFVYLPPAGILPLSSVEWRGYSLSEFFRDFPYRNPVFIDEARVDALLTQSFTYPPVKLASHEFLWLYFGQENRRANISGSGPQQEFVIFATGHMPFLAQPRFDLSRWDYSNYASIFLGP